MNILEYIEELIEQGYTEEDAAISADVMFNENYCYNDYDDDYYEEPNYRELYSEYYED